MPPEDVAVPTLKPAYNPSAFFVARCSLSMSETARLRLKAELETQLGMPVIVLCEGITLSRHDAS